MIATDERKQQLAELTGQAPDSIRGIKMQLDVLRKQGILVDLDIRGTSIFTRTASWAEIGIQADAKDPRFSRLTKGQKFLIPEQEIRALKSIETRMRYWLDKYSYDVTGFRPFRWLPYTAYEQWSERWSELKDEFYSQKAHILANLDTYRDALAAGFAEVAEASWKAITAQGYEWVIVDGRAMDHDAFIDFVVSSAVSKMPADEEIESALHCDYVTALVYGEADAAEDAAQAQIIRAEAQAQTDALYMQESAEREKFRHEQRMNQLAEDEKQSKIAGMRQAEAEHARAQLTELASPFQEVFSALRGQMAADAKQMLESIKKNGFVRGKVAEKGRGLIEMFNLLAVQDDYELRGQLIALKNALGPGSDTAEERTAETVKALEEMVQLEKSAVADLVAEPSRFSMVEI